MAMDEGHHGYEVESHGQDWAYDDRGQPYPIGPGDPNAWPEEYEYAEGDTEYVDHGGGYAHEQGGYEQHGNYSSGHAQPGYGYSSGYSQPGYGYIWASPGMVTETITTTTTTGGCDCYEEEVVHAPPPPRRHKVKTKIRRLLPGERG